jgi:Rieske Fe-S protein
MQSNDPSSCSALRGSSPECSERDNNLLHASRRGFLGLAATLTVTALTDPTKVLATITPDTFSSKGGKIAGLYRINFSSPGLSVLRNVNGSVRIGDVPILQVLQFRSIVLTRIDTNTFSALNEDCPHEGSSIELFNPSSREFWCRAHDSYFGPTGTRLRGPATRGLTSYPVTFTPGNDFLFIDVPGITSAKSTEQATTGIRTIGPNPATEQMTVEFVVSEAQHVRIALVNLIGEDVLTVVDQPFTVGVYKRNVNVAAIARGVHFCILDSSSGRDSVKVILR